MGSADGFEPCLEFLLDSDNFAREAFFSLVLESEFCASKFVL